MLKYLISHLGIESLHSRHFLLQIQIATSGLFFLPKIYFRPRRADIGLPYSAITFSGNKSLHFIISLEEQSLSKVAAAGADLAITDLIGIIEKEKLLKQKIAAIEEAEKKERERKERDDTRDDRLREKEQREKEKTEKTGKWTGSITIGPITVEEREKNEKN